jgi:hypothetical protein
MASADGMLARRFLRADFVSDLLNWRDMGETERAFSGEHCEECNQKS